MKMLTFSSQDMLQKYLASQSKLSTMVPKPKQNILSTKKDLKTRIKKNKLETSTKNLKPNAKTIPSNKESGSEYFPSTESGKKKKKPTQIFENQFNLYII